MENRNRDQRGFSRGGLGPQGMARKAPSEKTTLEAIEKPKKECGGGRKRPTPYGVDRSREMKIQSWGKQEPLGGEQQESKEELWGKGVKGGYVILRKRKWVSLESKRGERKYQLTKIPI